jgi:hypothetical protein
LVGEKNDDIRFLRSANWLLKKNKLIKWLQNFQL